MNDAGTLLEQPGGYLHLNREGRWHSFAWRGLERELDGCLALARLPAIATPEDTEAQEADSRSSVVIDNAVGGAPAGVAADGDGRVFWTGAAENGPVLTSRDPCDGSVAPLPIDPDADLLQPRALAIHDRRGALLVADSERARITLLALDGYGLLEHWGEGLLLRPISVAVNDNTGDVYVLDAGEANGGETGAGAKVFRFDSGGLELEGFHEVVEAAYPTLELMPPAAPEGSCPALAFDGRVLWLMAWLDADSALFPLTPEGGAGDPLLLDQGGGRRLAPAGLAVVRKTARPHGCGLGLDAAHSALYVGDNASRSMFRIDSTPNLSPTAGRILGAAQGFGGPVAGLAATHHQAPGYGDTLYLHPGHSALANGGSPTRFNREGATVPRGLLWSRQPVEVDGLSHSWQRLRVISDGDPGVSEMPVSGIRTTFYVHAAGVGMSPPSEPDPAALGGTDGGLDPTVWRRLANGVGDALVAARSSQLWLAALVEAGEGAGVHPSAIAQLRLDFDHAGYARHLPAIYRRPEKVIADPAPQSRELLERLLALFESFHDDAGAAIADVSRLFDPATAPVLGDGGPSWLDWLGGWLAVNLPEIWPEEKKRRLLATAFERLRDRGTAAGLRRALLDELEIDALVEEPHAAMSWWLLPPPTEEARSDGIHAPPRPGLLGITTRLATAEPQGAVVGRSAVLDRSHLIEDEDVGEPLFSGTAYRFTVHLPRSQAAAPATLERVQQLVEREKPAHTDYRICLVEPGIRVGFQALVGVDTLLGGGPPTPGRLGESDSAARSIGGGLVLGGRPTGRVGSSRIGSSTRLGSGRPAGRFSRSTDLNDEPDGDPNRHPRDGAGHPLRREEGPWTR